MRKSRICCYCLNEIAGLVVMMMARLSGLGAMEWLFRKVSKEGAKAKVELLCQILRIGSGARCWTVE